MKLTGIPSRDTARCLRVNQGPIAAATLGVLVGFAGVIQGELDIVKGTELVVSEHGRAVAVRCDGELHR